MTTPKNRQIDKHKHKKTDRWANITYKQTYKPTTPTNRQKKNINTHKQIDRHHRQTDIWTNNTYKQTDKPTTPTDIQMDQHLLQTERWTNNTYKQTDKPTKPTNKQMGYNTNIEETDGQN